MNIIIYYYTSMFLQLSESVSYFQIIVNISLLRYSIAHTSAKLCATMNMIGGYLMH